MAESMIRVFLLDDHEIVRRGVGDLIDAEPDLEVVGEAATAAEALARVPAARPDVAVLDVRLPDGDGVTVCRELRSAMPDVRCLMLTSFADDDALFDAVLAGASGYVLKQIRGTEDPAPGSPGTSRWAERGPGRVLSRPGRAGWRGRGRTSPP